MSARLAIGIGCRHGCAGAVIAALVREAAGDRDLAGARLYTIDRKRDEPGMHDAAAALALPLVFLSADELAAVADRVATRSARVEAAMGVPSVAEAAALAGAGPGSSLAVPRIARDGATCAIALAEIAGVERGSPSPRGGEVESALGSCLRQAQGQAPSTGRGGATFPECAYPLTPPSPRRGEGSRASASDAIST